MTDGDVAKDGERDGQPHGDRVRGDVEPVVEQQVADPGCRVAALVVRPRVAVEVGGVGNVEEHRRVVRYRPTQPGRLRVFVLDLSRSRSQVEVVEGT